MTEDLEELSFDEMYSDDENEHGKVQECDQIFTQQGENPILHNTVQDSNGRYKNEVFNMKNPPISTERTISLSSTSAPQGIFHSFVNLSLQGVVPSKDHMVTSNSPSKSPKAHRMSPVEHFFKEKNLNSSDTARPYNKASHTNSNDDYEPHGNRRMAYKKEKSTEERDGTLHVCRFDDDDSGIVGSLPDNKYLMKVQNKVAGDHTKSSQKERQKNRRDCFVTINTLSFNKFISPETPFIRIGKPEASRKLLVTVGIHGNEPCGLHAFNELLQEAFFDDLPSYISLSVLVGNPAAVSKEQRFIQHNLNRMIREDLFKRKEYEAERAKVVAHAIQECDVLLDLHSCSASSPAHALPMDNQESVSLAMKMPVTYIIKHLVHTTPGNATTIDYARKWDKIGTCVECGQHTSRKTVDTAKICIKALIESERNPKEKMHAISDAVVLTCTENEPVRKQFKFVRDVKAFEYVPYQEVIATDVRGNIISKYPGGTFIVMPTKMPVLGEEAFFYAEREILTL